MNLLVVLLLAVLWASILVPGAVRGRHLRSPLASIDSFERSMGILAPEHRTRIYRGAPPGRSILVIRDPRKVVQRTTRRSRSAARRRAILQVLLGAVAFAAVLALTVGGAAVHLLAALCVALAGYVGLLLHLKAKQARTRHVVRPLQADPPSADVAHEREPMAAGAGSA